MLLSLYDNVIVFTILDPLQLANPALQPCALPRPRLPLPAQLRLGLGLRSTRLGARRAAPPSASLVLVLYMCRVLVL